MTDLLAKPHKCDLCGSRKEQREFACLADEDSDHSICLDCTIFAEKLKEEGKQGKMLL